jgi:hypothetical protein
MARVADCTNDAAHNNDTGAQPPSAAKRKGGAQRVAGGSWAKHQETTHKQSRFGKLDSRRVAVPLTSTAACSSSQRTRGTQNGRNGTRWTVVGGGAQVSAAAVDQPSRATVSARGAQCARAAAHQTE